MQAEADHQQARRRATLVGLMAIALWATLASLTAVTAALPTYQLLAMSLALGSLVGLLLALRSPGGLRGAFRQPAAAWALGIYGIFGYHLFYLTALRQAPAVQANLLNYLWPLLIVLFSALLPGQRLRWPQIVGALLGLAGALLLVTGGRWLAPEPRYALGYLAALGCALIWSSYTVLLKRFGAVPTSAVAGVCAVSALLATLCHLLFERTVWPSGWQWAAVLAMGLGPMGAAFYAWDYGAKRGNVTTLGTLSYAAPLLSTLLLVALGLAQASPTMVLAAVCIVGGAALAAFARAGRRPQTTPRAE